MTRKSSHENITRPVLQPNPKKGWRQKHPSVARSIWVVERSITGFIVAVGVWMHPYADQAYTHVVGFYTHNKQPIDRWVTQYSAVAIVRVGAKLGITWCGAEDPHHEGVEKTVHDFLTDWDALAKDLFGDSVQKG